MKHANLLSFSGFVHASVSKFVFPWGTLMQSNCLLYSMNSLSPYINILIKLISVEIEFGRNFQVSQYILESQATHKKLMFVSDSSRKLGLIHSLHFAVKLLSLTQLLNLISSIFFCQQFELLVQKV